MSDKYNVESAETLANSAQALPIAKATPIYEQLLQLFPTAAKFWKQYVEAHMAVNNDDATKQIFSRCLLNCLQVPLWRCYIRFFRKVNDKKGTEGQEETIKAFEFMLNYIAHMASNQMSATTRAGATNDALYKELWHACAGPLVTLPREGERVYYFPQGHMEQLEASMNQGLEQQMPSFNLPSKILCKVVNIHLRAEPEKDEVYAQITLLPESDFYSSCY